MDKKSPDEELEDYVISNVETEALERVFKKLAGLGENNEVNDKFGVTEVAQVLKDLRCPQTKQEIQLMIWEVDDDLDGCVNKKEFETMYKRCVKDTTGLEPQKLFNLVQFLMFDKNNKGEITIEETLELLFVRHGMEDMNREIDAIFGVNTNNQTNEQEKSITFKDYLDTLNKRALAKRKNKVAKLKK